MNKLLLASLLLLSLHGWAQGSKALPVPVRDALVKAGSNRQELAEAIRYFSAQQAPLKLKALYFLLENMDAHYSLDYDWLDAKGRGIRFSEFDYSTFSAATKAAENIPSEFPGARMKPKMSQDLASVTARMLIEHINRSFDAWKSSCDRNIPFRDFCEYILPYRADVEPLENWQSKYKNQFSWLGKRMDSVGIQKSLPSLFNNVTSWFYDSYGSGARKEPLPRLGGLQLLFRKVGPCEDIADLSTFIFRSQGIATALDIVPFWGTSTGGHFTTTVFGPKMNAIQFDLSRNTFSQAVPREPAKVIRMTYSKQASALASQARAVDIPAGFLRMSNYVDVTQSYWPTTNVHCDLYLTDKRAKVAYASVLNGLSWSPVWWGRVEKNGVTFKNMSKGVVYLPGYYQNGKLVPAGDPVAEGYGHSLTLSPESNNRQTVLLNQESGYLNFKEGKRYKLFFWNRRWILISEKKAAASAVTMAFENVPKHSLLLLLPEYSVRKERPFIILDDGSRKWF